MNIKADSTKEYLNKIPEKRKDIMSDLVDIIRNNLPEGFQEVMQYGMPSWVVPHSLYPDGYHTTPELPLPFISIASQKSHIALYHMGVYADKDLHSWFIEEYPNHSKRKLDMGKSCIRWKKAEHVPVQLIGDLVKKMDPQSWIKLYESNYKKK